MIKEPDGKIVPKKWKKELEALDPEYAEARGKYSKAAFYGRLYGYGKPCDMAHDLWSKGGGIRACRSAGNYPQEC